MASFAQYSENMASASFIFPRRRAALNLAKATIAAVLAGLIAAKAEESTIKLNPTQLHDKALTVMENHCVSCHGPDKQKGDIRLDELETMDPVDLQKLYALAKEAVHFEDMPPEKADQPSEAERKLLLQWLDSKLTGDAAKALAEKLARFEYGNVVRHEDLFSGRHANLPAYTHDRRWIISEYIFSEKTNRLLDYKPTRKIYGTTHNVRGDSGIHWSPRRNMVTSSGGRSRIPFFCLNQLACATPCINVSPPGTC